MYYVYIYISDHTTVYGIKLWVLYSDTSIVDVYNKLLDWELLWVLVIQSALIKNWLILFSIAFPWESAKFVIDNGVKFDVSDGVKPNKSLILSLLSDWKLNSVFT